ncbi:unnamed protein product, partial [Coregonus sp. 'balchen']
TQRTKSVGQEPLRRQGSSSAGRAPQLLSAQAIKHIWVRTALFEKVLDKVVQYIYTKLKTSDHFWTDPSANELVQRHRIHGAHRGQDASPSRRPALGIRKRQSSVSMSEDKFAASAREYVESLHQNSRTHLLYGKNNKKEMEVLRGYLSLHQAGDNLTLKWTPNQLINGTLGDSDCGGTLVLVSQDGIQHPLSTSPPAATSWPSCPAWRQACCPTVSWSLHSGAREA